MSNRKSTWCIDLFVIYIANRIPYFLALLNKYEHTKGKLNEYQNYFYCILIQQCIKNPHVILLISNSKLYIY